MALRLSKPFILLAGISGTGKTRFIREQASKTGSIEKTYQLIPVRPDWHEPSDLLGYVSRVSGSPYYVATDVLRFIVKAWSAIADKNIDCQSKVIKGHILDLNEIPPYWLCLDEMNLAPVEQYFSDFLSILETRIWAKNTNKFEYSCDALLSGKLVNEGGHQLRNDLEITGGKYDALWDHFSNFGIGIPLNLIVAGTVNMDETTHGFSRKVLDRALSFDFGDFFPNNFDSYFNPSIEAVTLGYPIWSNASIELDALSTTIDKDGKKSIGFLSEVNEKLDGSYFKIAYRSLNDLLLSVIAFQPKSEIELHAVWDDFVMCKILPRIEGDIDKLAIHGGTSDAQVTILSELKELLAKKLSSIWNDESRPDLYRRFSGTTTTDRNIQETNTNTILIACRSKNKISWMENRLTNTSFTNYWP
ncbi:restriction endonuclease [Polynucleobacter sp. Adler-ghost]|nr:restriction endonuclease [Polynucleobacter sp. Adler-ghost]